MRMSDFTQSKATCNQSTSAIPRFETIIFSCSIKSDPVAYSVSNPTAIPNMVHLHNRSTNAFTYTSATPRYEAQLEKRASKLSFASILRHLVRETSATNTVTDCPGSRLNCSRSSNAALVV
ncbi:hypothetical protein Mapa_010821 [Marchantia paleacea]|nr:hypothetical protein Mapa_010821 [Marchantia paleacea]